MYRPIISTHNRFKHFSSDTSSSTDRPSNSRFKIRPRFSGRTWEPLLLPSENLSSSNQEIRLVKSWILLRWRGFKSSTGLYSGVKILWPQLNVQYTLSELINSGFYYIPNSEQPASSVASFTEIVDCVSCTRWPRCCTCCPDHSTLPGSVAYSKWLKIPPQRVVRSLQQFRLTLNNRKTVLLHTQ